MIGSFKTAGKNMRKNIFWLAAFFFISSAYAEESGYSKSYDGCLKNAANTVGMMECIRTELDVQDKRLNKAYQGVLKIFAEDRKNKLREVQRAWIKYRDNNCNMHVGISGGTADNLNASFCILELTRQRSQELEKQMEQWSPL